MRYRWIFVIALITLALAAADRFKLSQKFNYKPSFSNPSPSNTKAFDKGYLGKQLAGNSSFYLDFDLIDFDHANKDGKYVLQYFTTPNCGACPKEIETIKQGFNSLTSDSLIGQEVHLTGKLGTTTEEELAQRFKVDAAQTKLIFKEGKEIYRSLTPWTLESFNQVITEILSH